MSKLFAFKVSAPLPAEPTQVPTAYDPEAQQIVWQSGGGAVAYYCSLAGVGYGFSKCSIWYEGNVQYCALSNRHYPWSWPPLPAEIVSCDPG